ncbi:hypothetical protein SDC9_180448 [bioreactor metagenome]|uniref:Uncharacterized protein n=1 Tax=bioreactor metagenome TaxID=1076179 RepID=A0A645H1R4_9ZZZZ
MPGVLINLIGVAKLHHRTQIHDGHPVADMLDHAQIMGNKNIGKIMPFLQRAEKIKHLGLYRNVQGGNGLVANDDLGLQNQSPGYIDALALAAGELVGIAVHVLHVQAYLPQHSQHRFPPLFAVPLQAVDDQRLFDGGFGGKTGVQGRIGILKNHLQLFADRLKSGIG